MLGLASCGDASRGGGSTGGATSTGGAGVAGSTGAGVGGGGAGVGNGPGGTIGSGGSGTGGRTNGTAGSGGGETETGVIIVTFQGYISGIPRPFSTDFNTAFIFKNTEQAETFIAEFADELHNPQVLDCP